MIRTWLAGVAIAVTPAVCLAQTPGSAQTVRAAGMPLKVTDLPAGTLAVRLVRGAFVENLAGRVVALDAPGGMAASATTDLQGRATFAVPVGALVHATADIDGERLESQSFAMPDGSGVRVLLVAGGGGAPAGAASGPLPPGHPAIDEAARPSVQGEGAAADQGDSRAIIAVLLAAVTFAMAGAIYGRSAVRRRADPPA